MLTLVLTTTAKIMSLWSEEWQRWKLPDRADVIPVSSILHPHIIPSETIYYHTYPYSIKLSGVVDADVDRYEKRRQIALFKVELEQFNEDWMSYPIRSYVSVNTQRIYFRTYGDLQRALTIYHDAVQCVYGPIDNDHIDILLSRDYHCDVRKPYYGQYNTKVMILNRVDISQVSSYQASKQQHKEILKDLKEFVLESFDDDQDKVRWFARYYNSVDFYIDYDDLLSVLPFIKLQYPTVRLVITRCISK